MRRFIEGPSGDLASAVVQWMWVSVRFSEAKKLTEERAKEEVETPSLIEPDSPERLASWASTLAVLEYMEEHGIPEPLADDSD